MCMAEQWCGDLMMRGGISGCKQLADDVVDCWQLAGCSSGNLQVAAHFAQCLTLAQSLFIYSAPGVCDLPVTGSTTSTRMSSIPLQALSIDADQPTLSFDIKGINKLYQYALCASTNSINELHAYQQTLINY